jgi:hypothetical protein
VERVRAKKGYGQNFLTDKSVSQSIASDALLVSGDTVLEIGPGQSLIPQNEAPNNLTSGERLWWPLCNQFGHNGFCCCLQGPAA